MFLYTGGDGTTRSKIVASCCCRNVGNFDRKFDHASEYSREIVEYRGCTGMNRRIRKVYVSFRYEIRGPVLADYYFVSTSFAIISSLISFLFRELQFHN